MNFPPVILDSLLFDLFQKLREAGMKLTLDQYDLLRQAVEQGYGLGGWQDLKRVCRLLWVKPCPSYDANIFERTFDNYEQLKAEMLVKTDNSSTSQLETTTTYY